MSRRVGTAALLLALPVATLGACSTDDTTDPTPPPTVESNAGPTTAEASIGTTVPPATDGPSLVNLMRADFDGHGLRVLHRQVRTDAYTRLEVAYRSNDRDVSGVLIRPHGQGPFPAIVLNHGYIEPSIYVTGQGLAREQDWLGRAGFVVLHTDYRGHAASDPTTDLERETRLGYARDSINAVLALKKLSYVDPDRTAMLGRSMGGGVTLDALVAAPGLVDAAVIYASVSSSFLDNLRRWTIPERPRSAQALFARFGSPRQNPEFYRGLSPSTHFDRITEPVLMFHGLADTTCPPRWSRTTHRLLARAGVENDLVEYAGEGHAFYARWQDSIERTVRFLRDRLDD
jgi:dipeptidyl aminopeptidase/acylaminoacyl peptidase